MRVKVALVGSSIVLTKLYEISPSPPFMYTFMKERINNSRSFGMAILEVRKSRWRFLQQKGLAGTMSIFDLDVDDDGSSRAKLRVLISIPILATSFGPISLNFIIRMYFGVLTSLFNFASSDKASLFLVSCGI